MMDLDLGMNNWMSDGFKYPDKPIDRGKRLTKEILAKLGEWGRYKDVDGDGIVYRTIPGDGLPCTSHGAPATTPRVNTASGPTTTSKHGASEPQVRDGPRGRAATRR